MSRYHNHPFQRPVSERAMAGETTRPHHEKGICRVCGCSETSACLTNGRPCTWFDEAERTLCTNPKCLDKANVRASDRPPLVTFPNDVILDYD